MRHDFFNLVDLTRSYRITENARTALWKTLRSNPKEPGEK
jgi:hypothetical protein